MPNRDGRYDTAFGRLAVGIALMLAVAFFGDLGSTLAAIHARRSEVQQGTTCNRGDPNECAVESYQANVRAANANEDTIDLGIFQVGLNIAAIVGLVFTVWYARRAWKEAQRSANVAHEALSDTRADTAEQAQRFEKQIEIARKTAEAALLSARVSEAALLNGPRPMLVIELGNYSEMIPPNPTDSHPFVIGFKITNAGERNATVESVVAHLVAYQREAGAEVPPFPAPSREHLDGDPMAEELLPNAAVLLPRGVLPLKLSSYISMTEEETRRLYGIGYRRLVFLILATYSDPYGVKRERGVTMFYSPLARGVQWSLLETPEHSFDRVINRGALDFSRERDGKGEIS